MRPLVAARLAWGGALLAAPGLLFRVMGGGTADVTWRVVGRLLGLRHLAEAVLEQRAKPPGPRLAAGADTLHALSAAALAVTDPRRRRVAAVDAVVAGGFAVMGWRGTTPASPTLIGS